MIIVEGSDGAGKSTLVNTLCEEFHLPVGERAVADRELFYTDARRATYIALSRALRGNHSPEVWDRLYFSELVYADIIPGRECEFKLAERRFIHGLIEHLRCPVIFCCPDFATVEANAAKDEQMDGVNENLMTIYQRYRNSIRWPTQTWVYNYLEPDALDRVIQHVQEYLNRRSFREW